MKKLFIIIFLLLPACGLALPTSQDHFFTLSYSRSRAMGMGGAFVAVEGGVEAALFNPATLRISDVARGAKLSVFLNPLVSGGLYELYRSQTEDKLTRGQWWNILRTLPKAVFLSTPVMELGLINHEELETRENFHPNRNFIEADHFFQHHFETAVIRIRLAEQVSIGGSMSHYSRFVADSVQQGFGASYGVFIRPTPKVGVGIVFIDLPGNLQDIRMKYDRFEGQTVNVGIAYHPFSMTTLSLDVRNLSEDNRATTREVHVGVEQGLWRHLYLRTGYFRDSEIMRSYVTAGIGILNLSFESNGHRKFAAPTLALNYSILLEPGNENTVRWHFLTFNWGF